MHAPQFCRSGRHHFGKYPWCSSYLFQVKFFLFWSLVVSFGLTPTKRGTQMRITLSYTFIFFHPFHNQNPWRSQASSWSAFGFTVESIEMQLGFQNCLWRLIKKWRQIMPFITLPKFDSAVYSYSSWVQCVGKRPLLSHIWKCLNALNTVAERIIDPHHLWCSAIRRAGLPGTR